MVYLLVRGQRLDILAHSHLYGVGGTGYLEVTKNKIKSKGKMKK